MSRPPARKAKRHLTPAQRLRRIALIIEEADRRCEFSDGAVSRLPDELTDVEWRRIYLLAKGRRKR